MKNKKAFSSTLPLDLRKLESLTESKHTLQEELLQMFFSNASECIEVMERNCMEAGSTKWNNAAEELQFLSDMIGAMELSKICSCTLNKSTSNSLKKKKIIADIRATIHKLRVFIRNTRY